MASGKSERPRLLNLKKQGHRVTDVLLKLLERSSKCHDQRVYAISRINVIFGREVKLQYVVYT